MDVFVFHSIVLKAMLGVRMASHIITSCLFIKKVKLPFSPLFLPLLNHYNTHIFSLYMILLPAILHSLVKDLDLGENMPPAELCVSVKQSDWKPSSLLTLFE